MITRVVLGAWIKTLVAGAIIGATAMLAVNMSLFTRAPVISLTLEEKDGVAIAGTSIETHYRFVRNAQCNTISQTWLWKWTNEGTGAKRQYFIPLATTFVTLSDVSPLVQDFVVAVPLPATVTPGQWFIHSKGLDYCHLLAWLWGPTIRVNQDIPVTVLPSHEVDH